MLFTQADKERVQRALNLDALPDDDFMALHAAANTPASCPMCGPRSDDPVVQYLIVNRDLTMSPGKLAAQSAHGTTLTMLPFLTASLAGGRTAVPAPADADAIALFQEWVDTGYTKIVLRAKETQLLELERQGYAAVRDHGHTEVPINSLTVVAFPPMRKSAAKPLVKRFQLF